MGGAGTQGAVVVELTALSVVVGTAWMFVSDLAFFSLSAPRHSTPDTNVVFNAQISRGFQVAITTFPSPPRVREGLMNNTAARAEPRPVSSLQQTWLSRRTGGGVLQQQERDCGASEEEAGQGVQLGMGDGRAAGTDGADLRRSPPPAGGRSRQGRMAEENTAQDPRGWQLPLIH